MRETGRGLAVVLLVAMVAVTACARPEDVGAPPGLRIEPSWISCEVAVPDPSMLLGADAIDLPLVGDAFPATSAVVCDAQPRRRPDGGEDLLATESRADEVDALLAALRLPDEPRTGGACTADLPVVAWFALLDAQGRWVRPGLPIDRCGKIRIEVRDALAALSLTTVSTRVLREIESAEAVAAGCAQQWADLVWVETTQTNRGWGSPGAEPFASGADIRLCVYRVPAGEQGSGKPAGEFEHGGILRPDRWTAIATAVQAAGPAPTCSTPAGRFALLRQIDGRNGEIYVELDGCRRIMKAPLTGRPSLAQGDAALIALLDAQA